MRLPRKHRLRIVNRNGRLVARWLHPRSGKFREKVMPTSDRATALALATDYLSAFTDPLHIESALEKAAPRRGCRGSDSTPGFIYALEAIGLNRVKIGWAKSVRQRLRKIAAIIPVETRLVAARAGTRADEAAIHRDLDRWNVKHEWFTLSDEVSAYIALHLAATRDMAG